METYIALLRGINVGGHNKILMKDLKKIFEDLGCKDVKTYIQSGNVIFKNPKAEKSEKLESLISEAINNKYGYKISVLVKTDKQIATILDQCPFKEDKKEVSYFIVLQNPPLEENVKPLTEISYPNEEFVITDYCVYIFYTKGYSNAKCTNNFFEKKLKVTTTARNFKTLTKLLEISSAD